MLLGSAETLGNQSHLFTPVDGRLKIYKRPLSGNGPELFDFPSSFPDPKHQSLKKQRKTGQARIFRYLPSSFC